MGASAQHHGFPRPRTVEAASVAQSPTFGVKADTWRHHKALRLRRPTDSPHDIENTRPCLLCAVKASIGLQDAPSVDKNACGVMTPQGVRGTTKRTGWVCRSSWAPRRGKAPAYSCHGNPLLVVRIRASGQRNMRQGCPAPCLPETPESSRSSTPHPRQSYLRADFVRQRQKDTHICGCMESITGR